jgi:hypothetical protein
MNKKIKLKEGMSVKVKYGNKNKLGKILDLCADSVSVVWSDGHVYICSISDCKPVRYTTLEKCEQAIKELRSVS